jgi:hypothetical protein
VCAGEAEEICEHHPTIHPERSLKAYSLINSFVVIIEKLGKPSTVSVP